MRTDPRDRLSPGDPGDGVTDAVPVAAGGEVSETANGVPAAPVDVAPARGSVPAWLSGLAAAPLPLLVLVFVGGVVSLGLEVSGPRLMAPYFGTTELIWATQIGFTLIYLAIGYYIGGRVADRHPDARLLCTLTSIAAVAAALIPFVSAPILGWSVGAFGAYNADESGTAAGIFIASLVGVLLLFSVPTILLGMVSPFAVRLSVRQVGTTGSSAGSLYALSTVGSIIGAFLPVLVLAPAWGVRATIIVLALALLLASLWGLRLRMRTPMILLALVFLVLIPLFSEGMNGPMGPLKRLPGLIYEQESRYNYIQVVQQTDTAADGTTRVWHELILNEGEAIHSIYTPDEVLIGCPAILGGTCWYSDYTLAAPYFNPGFKPSQIGKVAIIGLAGGTMVRQWDAAYHPARIDGAELDPAIVAVSRTYFGLTESNLHVYTGDGRTFMVATRQTYDALIVDAFQQPYIPFQLTTIEFYTEVLNHLSAHGIISINTAHCGGDRQLIHALVNTLYKAGFASVYTLDVPGALNTEIFATKAPTTLDIFSANVAAQPSDPSDPSDALSASVAAQALGLLQVAPVQPGGLVFTDDRAPVEQITDSLVLACATHSGT